MHSASQHAALLGSYEYRLVALSVVIAVVSAYAALDLGGRVTASQGRLRTIWLGGGAIAMGTGIWAMHYIGMLAYSLPVPILYDLPTVLVSLLAAMLASAVALFLVSRDNMGALRTAFGGVLMGSGIAAMHYIGMEAMRLPAMCQYSPGLVRLSVALAVAISMVALWLTFHLRSETGALGWKKLCSAVLMGAAIPIMHYTGMAAVSYTPMTAPMDLSHSVQITDLGIAGIGIVTFLVLGLAIMTSLVDRRFSAQSAELELSEQRYRQLVESAKVILWRGSNDLSVSSFINHEAEILLGYPQEQWVRTPGFWLNCMHPDDRGLVADACRTAAATDGTQRFEHRMIASSGAVFWLRTSVQRVVGNQKDEELVGVMVDVTERKQALEAAELAHTEIERLNLQLRSENSRMGAELEVTCRLQQMMLPRAADFEEVSNLDIAGSMDPASEVGGDYFDVVSQDGKVFFGIGDVTGHGLESGVIAIMVQTAVRTLLASGLYESPKFFEILNRVIYDNTRRMHCDRNLTFSLLQYHDRQVTITGQHEEVLIVRKNGLLERHDTLNLGFPLGLEPDISRFVAHTKVPLNDGDVMVIYTDGIPEAVNHAGICYGLERLSQAVVESHTLPAEGIRGAVLHNLREYIGGQHVFDDISLLVIKPEVEALS